MLGRTWFAAVAVVALVGAACGGAAGDETTASTFASPTGDVVPETRDVSAYDGLGAWVDVFDYAPAYQAPGQPPAVTPASVSDMGALGVETLYLQAARDDDRSPGGIVDEALVGEFLVRAHEAGVRVVAWYLPTHADVDRDLDRMRMLHEFVRDRQRFDGLAVDIESVDAVPDHAERNRRLVDFSRRLDEAVGGDPIGAIVLAPVALEVVNDALWPDFPWSDLAGSYDVWMPMSYWTLRDDSSPYRDAYTYTDENIRRLRADLGDDDAVVHPIGGIGDAATRTGYEGFVRAATEAGALGWSIYDYATQASPSWEHLRSP